MQTRAVVLAGALLVSIGSIASASALAQEGVPVDVAMDKDTARVIDAADLARDPAPFLGQNLRMEGRILRHEILLGDQNQQISTLLIGVLGRIPGQAQPQPVGVYTQISPGLTNVHEGDCFRLWALPTGQYVQISLQDGRTVPAPGLLVYSMEPAPDACRVPLVPD